MLRSFNLSPSEENSTFQMKLRTTRLTYVISYSAEMVHIIFFQILSPFSPSVLVPITSFFYSYL